MIRHDLRPDHVVLAGHTGRLVARSGLLCHTRLEVDEHVIATALAATRDLGRPVTGAELHSLWEAAHTIWAELHPLDPDHLGQLLDRIGKAFAARMMPAIGQVEQAAARGAKVLRQIACSAPPHVRDVLPEWMTEEPVQPSDPWMAVLG